jgi:hypothetical protein
MNLKDVIEHFKDAENIKTYPCGQVVNIKNIVPREGVWIEDSYYFDIKGISYAAYINGKFSEIIEMDNDKKPKKLLNYFDVIFEGKLLIRGYSLRDNKGLTDYLYNIKGKTLMVMNRKGECISILNEDVTNNISFLIGQEK